MIGVEHTVEFINISRVSVLTGIPPVTLRAWERRYGLPKPQRTASGHRLYSMAEVALVQRLIALMDNGYSISRAVAQLQNEDTQQLETTAHQALPSRWETYRYRLLNALDNYDISAIEATYGEALSLFPVDRVIDEVMLPVLDKVGSEWESRADGIAREHFFTAFLRNKIGTRFSHELNRVHGPIMLLACLPGENHEMGLMLFGLTATARNYRVIYFGADLPLAQLAPVASKTSPTAIVLSGSYVELNEPLKQQLRTLSQQFSGRVYLGGELSEHYGDGLRALGVVPVGKNFRNGAELILRNR